MHLKLNRICGEGNEVNVLGFWKTLMVEALEQVLGHVNGVRKQMTDGKCVMR